MHGDYVEEVLRQAIQGIVPVGFDPGAIVRVGADALAAAGVVPGMSPPTNIPFGRSARSLGRRAPLGIPNGTVPANASFTFTSLQVSRVFHCDRLLIIPEAPGLVIDSISIGDDEQVLTRGASVELYGPNALTDTKPDNFSPLQTGTAVSITLRNTTAAPIDVTLGMKGGVER